jgi:acetyl esterase/lipase
MASEKDVSFASAGDIDLKLDIYRPDEASTRAAIIFLHGGGWRGGSREAMRPLARAMAGFGFVGLPAQYRLTGQSPWPAQIHDVKAAIRWTRANAERLGVDSQRIVLWGSSAGAHLALLAAGTPDDPQFEGEIGPKGVSSAVQAVIAVHPPTSFYVGPRDLAHSSAIDALMGPGAGEADARAASPLTHVSASFPPTLLLHGTEDRVVHHSSSQRMLDALRAVRAPADMHLFHGQNHGFESVPSVRAMLTAEAAYFLDRTLIDPEKHLQEIQKFSMFAQRAAVEAAANA